MRNQGRKNKEGFTAVIGIWIFDRLKVVASWLLVKYKKWSNRILKSIKLYTTTKTCSNFGSTIFPYYFSSQYNIFFTSQKFEKNQRKSLPWKKCQIFLMFGTSVKISGRPAIRDLSRIADRPDYFILAPNIRKIRHFFHGSDLRWFFWLAKDMLYWLEN